MKTEIITQLLEWGTRSATTCRIYELSKGKITLIVEEEDARTLTHIGVSN